LCLQKIILIAYHPLVSLEMVLVPTPTKKSVYEKIFNDGVIVVKKDSKLAFHRDFDKVPNLHVMMLTNSLHSRYVKIIA
jgi:hypothetical protein